MLNLNMVDRIVVFKGGVMDGTEITYQEGGFPENKEEMFVKSSRRDFWFGTPDEIYIFSSDLSSWVYDHENVIVEGEKE